MRWNNVRTVPETLYVLLLKHHILASLMMTSISTLHSTSAHRSLFFFKFWYKGQQKHFTQGKGGDNSLCARTCVSAFHLYQQWLSDNRVDTEMKHAADGLPRFNSRPCAHLHTQLYVSFGQYDRHSDSKRSCAVKTRWRSAIRETVGKQIWWFCDTRARINLCKWR